MSILTPYLTGFQARGTVPEDVPRLLKLRGHEETAHHCARVAAEARALARRFGLNLVKAETAGWLHDVSVVIPNHERCQVARQAGINVLPEEDVFPMIVHQKLSSWMAHEVFGIHDPEVLSAIGCHTTLRAGASPLDKLVFVADKIAWDQAGQPPYLEVLQAALEHSLNAAALVYIDYLWAQRAQLRVIHPWLVAARNDLLLHSL